jgi:phosphate/phosphite/phosphonate ABC transporter binding protein
MFRGEPRTSLQRIVFGLVVPSAGSDVERHVDAFLGALSRQIAIPVVRRDAASYEALAADVRDGRADAAWLPPIVFVTLGDVVRGIGSVLRGTHATYDAALVVRADSTITALDGLRGTRVAWVDRWSAAGYVLPRLHLAMHGLDPRRIFRSETFHGSHRSAIAAVLDGDADVAGTYAHVSAGRAVAGGWNELEPEQGAPRLRGDGTGRMGVRVLATSGAIPPDVLAVRAAVADKLQDILFDGVTAICSGAPALPRAIFGGSEITSGLAPGYDALRHALAIAGP